MTRLKGICCRPVQSCCKQTIMILAIRFAALMPCILLIRQTLRFDENGGEVAVIIRGQTSGSAACRKTNCSDMSGLKASECQNDRLMQLIFCRVIMMNACTKKVRSKPIRKADCAMYRQCRHGPLSALFDHCSVPHRACVV